MYAFVMAQTGRIAPCSDLVHDYTEGSGAHTTAWPGRTRRGGSPSRRRPLVATRAPVPR
jgi:hypothetical protein